MLRLATDADVHGEIIRGLRRRSSAIDLLRAQDALPEGTPDPEVLAWAAAENRVLITNDRNTMVGFAYQRVAAADPVPGRDRSRAAWRGQAWSRWLQSWGRPRGWRDAACSRQT